MDKMLRLTIDEYATPAFCSSYKYVYGTLEHMTDFVNYLRGVKKATVLVEAFDKYLAGDKKVKYNVAYSSMQMMHNCKVLECKEGRQKDFSYDFTNIWGFLYNFRASEVSYKKVMIEYKKEIIIAIMPTFKDLYIHDDIGGNHSPIHGDFWGFPGIYDYDQENNITRSRLFLVEKAFKKNETESTKSVYEFFNSDNFDLTTCFEEIVGDGLYSQKQA